MDDWVGVGVGYGGGGGFGEDGWVGMCFCFLFFISAFLIGSRLVLGGGAMADEGRSLGSFRLGSWRLRFWGV